MSRGQADFGQYAPKSVGAGVSDMGEVAARLGSIVTYDKRGDVVDFDNFEEPVLRWSAETWGVGSVTVLDDTFPKSGSQSVKLSPANLPAAFARISKGVALLGSKKLGLEISFCYLQSNNYLQLTMERQTATTLQTASLKLDVAALTIELIDQTGGWVVLTAIAGLEAEDFLFHTIKLVVDFDNEVYMRVLLDDQEYDASAVRISSVPNIADTVILVQVESDINALTSEDCWIDDFVLTQAEP